MLTVDSRNAALVTHGLVALLCFFVSSIVSGTMDEATLVQRFPGLGSVTRYVLRVVAATGLPCQRR
jgi:hypothetical protein